ncbi:hypothetical protein [Methylobacterium sp. PvR107]|uniref:hypothetical protein n=1 Tax=Methylobacterium sp. PvR107 TaxID=2806597 RepID=UPI001B7325FE|nr:hypothetical protein [Methylobacterium sp. PvR107]MBP1183779.1 hypothetical protein [Methylobacterium sp. PvR107]
MARLVAWVLVIAITVITLVPLGLRPVVTASPSIERSAAYAALGLCMVWGYPLRWPWVLLGCVLLAGGLEAAQHLTSTRHGRFDDFLVKAAASAVGVLIGLGVVLLLERRSQATTRG